MKPYNLYSWLYKHTYQQEKTPAEWADLLGIQIIDPDGWRSPNEKDVEEPLPFHEFCNRAWMSTIGVKPDAPRVVEQERLTLTEEQRKKVVERLRKTRKGLE